MKTKVLIIDSDILARRTITGILHKTSGFEITDIREDINKAEETILNFNPDVLLLNIDKSKADSFTIFSTLRIRFPKLPIIVLSVRNKKGAKAAITALSNGAVNVITKPESHLSILFADNHLSKRLGSIIKAAAQIENLQNLLPNKTSFPQYTYEELTSRTATHMPTNLIVIGACMGGPHSLFSIVPRLPKNLIVPIVITQHLPKFYTKFLAEQLDATSTIIVKEAYKGAKLTPGIVWIAPGGYHTEIVSEDNSALLNVHRGPRVNDARPSIDLLFNSAAYSYGKEVLGIILSGCGDDGIDGCKTIKAMGGQTIIQNPRDCLAPEMPLTVLKRGLADDNFSTQELPLAILNRIKGIHKKDVQPQP